MRAPFLLLLLSLCAAGVHSQCTGVPNPQTTPLPLNTFRDSPPGNGNWVLQTPNSVLQTINSAPTAFVSPLDGSLGQVVKGTISVPTNSDDDYLGFIFGLDCTPAPPAIVTSCSGPGVLFDWKKANQSPGVVGTAVSTFTNWPTGDFWGHTGSVTEIARGNNFGSTGWVSFQSYDFVSVYTRTRLQVFINGAIEFDVTGNFPLGRNGFYGYSQDNTLYSDIQVVEATGTHQCVLEPVEYTFDFDHSGGCNAADFSLSVIWDINDGTEGTTVFPTPTTFGASTGTFDISNVYTNEGAHIFRMQLLKNNVPEGAAVDEFALVREPVDVSISMVSNANCGFDTRCDADTAILSFVTSEGGTPAYTALWTDNDTTCCAGGTCSACDSTRTVGAGSYGVTLTDLNGCTDVSNVINVRASSVSSLSFSEPTCGNLNTFVNGNCPGFTYSWSTIDGCTSCLTPGATSQSGLEPGTYDLTVTDQNGCTRSASYTTTYQITSPATEDELIYMYLPFTWSWQGFHPGTTGTVYIEHTVTSRRVDLFAGDVSTTQSVDYSIHMFEPGWVMLNFEASGAASCVVRRRFYLCASNHTNDPMCDQV